MENIHLIFINLEYRNSLPRRVLLLRVNLTIHGVTTIFFYEHSTILWHNFSKLDDTRILLSLKNMQVGRVAVISYCKKIRQAKISMAHRGLTSLYWLIEILLWYLL